MVKTYPKNAPSIYSLSKPMADPEFSAFRVECRYQISADTEQISYMLPYPALE